MKKNHKEPTIYDIARELNVSPSTVSRALKDHYSIGKKTIKAVKKLAQERGYRPNSIAASLRSNKTNNLGVIISWTNRPFISSLISGVEMAANREGYNVIISQSHDKYENEVANAHALYDSRICGLVVSLAMETLDYKHFDDFMKNDIPVVFVDRVTTDLNSDTVIIDNFAAGYEATGHLIEQGCRRIAHIGGASHRNVYNERQRGYMECLKDHGVEVDDELIVQNSLSQEDGLAAAEYLLGLPAPPDGIFCANDTTAVSVIQYAKKKGLKIPDDLAIIGFNNDPISKIIEPGLSTIYHPAEEMGEIAARQVLKHRHQKEKEVVSSETIILKTRLLVRESSLRKK